MATLPPLDFLPALDKVGYRAWRTACVELAQTLDPASGDFGLLGFLLEDEEYTTCTGGTSFEPFVEPANDARDVKLARRLFERQRESLARFRRAVLASVPGAVLAAAPGYHPDFGTTRVDLRGLVTFLQKRSTFSSPTLYEGVLEQLATPFVDGSSMEEYSPPPFNSHYYI